MNKENGEGENPVRIKIFSTQRIDKQCDVFDCDSIIPIRCGAVYDESYGGDIIGDDTGDNISSKRNSFCELTTQYWAYKNVEADYYGFCHYRRYFSFSDERLPTDRWKSVLDGYIDERAAKKYEINDEKIRSQVLGCDIILPDVIPLKEVGIKSVYEQYKTAPLLKIEDVGLLLEIIKERHPETYSFAKSYFEGSDMVLCNMMIMKKEYFFAYSEWLFDILFEFEKRCDSSNYGEEAERTPGHLGERLLYIYCMYLEQTENVSIKHLQMVVFSNPEKQETLKPVFDDENTARIALSSSLYYAPFCAAVVKSVIDSSSEEHNYDVVILHTELPEKTKKLFLKMISGKKNFSIRFLDVRRAVYKFNLPVFEHFSIETYFRLAISSFLSDYKKLLYLDSDLIVLRDVFELYSSDVENYAFAGVIDACLCGINNGYNKNKPKYYEKYAFVKKSNLLRMINAGVLLMNLEFISKKYSAEQLLKYAEESAFELCDQDVINSLFQDDILILDQRWNSIDYDEETLPAWCVRFAPRPVFELYKSAAKNPYIIHFASTVKPWNEPGYKNADVFWETLRKTPFYEFVIHRRITENASYYAGSVSQSLQSMKKGAKIRPPRQKKEGLLRKIADKLYPRGTRRRERIKKIICFIKRKPYVEPYYPVV